MTDSNDQIKQHLDAMEVKVSQIATEATLAAHTINEAQIMHSLNVVHEITSQEVNENGGQVQD